MIILEYIIQITFILSLFYGCLEIQGFILTKTSEHANSFRLLTQSTLQLKRSSTITINTKKYSLYKKPAPTNYVLHSKLYLRNNHYVKKLNGQPRPLPKILTERGEIHLFSSMLLILITLSSTYIIYHEFRQTRLIKERKNLYLCLIKILEKNYKYTNEMGKLNKIITINYPLQFNPKTGPIHKEIISATKIIQEILTNKFKVSMVTNLPTCHIKNKIQLSRVFHYERNHFSGLLKRDMFERAIPRNDELKITLFPNSFKGDYFNLTFLSPLIHYPLKTNIQPILEKTL